MVYAYAVDGLDREQREAFDEKLRPSAVGKPEAESVAKVRRQREAQEQLMGFMGRARG